MAGTERLTAVAVALALTDPDARRPDLVGAKAANLARAAAAGLPVLPGFAITTAATGPAGRPEWPPTGATSAAIRDAWQHLGGGERMLVVRSSSTVEDIGTSSMAGQFRSVLGVLGWPAFVEAVATVLASAAQAGSEVRPMGVLVQPQLSAVVGGVMFGVDPVTGDAARLVIEAVRGNPDSLVSGVAVAQRVVTDPKGRIRDVDGAGRRHGAADLLLTRHQLRQLATLSRRAAAAFGGPQDVEWAVDGAGVLHLLQTRPVTATAHLARLVGPVLGPGPVAETFPLPLRPLELDLWLTPMRSGIVAALTRAGTVDPAALAASPVLLSVGGWAAADLELLGYVTAHRALRLIDPRPGARRLAAAWRVGRTRAELPARVADLITGTDAALADVGPPRSMPDGELIRVLDRGRDLLAELHEAEVLAATLGGAASASVVAAALQQLRSRRRQGLSDTALTAVCPLVLCLVPPSIGGAQPLPDDTPEPLSLPAATAVPGRRELLRLRARWVQELLARCADEAGDRLTARGQLSTAADVAWLTWAELTQAMAGHAAAPRRVEPGPPLPAQFRLDINGVPVGVRRPGVRGSGGVGAGGGRAVGVVVHNPADVIDGSILVTRTLDPRLSAVLPRLAGIVAETGSTLSHLAILAREAGVPAVVAVPDAMSRFAVGSRLLVDGTTGDVEEAP